MYSPNMFFIEDAQANSASLEGSKKSEDKKEVKAADEQEKTSPSPSAPSK